MMLPMQARAARGLLGWTQAELAAAAGVTQYTIAMFESERSVPHPSTMGKIEAALGDAGVRLVGQNDELGVTITRAAAAAARRVRAPSD